MMISDKQTQLAVEYLREHPRVSPMLASDVSPELVSAAWAIAVNTPDPRPDRVRDAQLYLGAGEMDAREVAEKMIARIICDSLR
jgi:hypothetical protein